VNAGLLADSFVDAAGCCSSRSNSASCMRKARGFTTLLGYDAVLHELCHPLITRWTNELLQYSLSILSSCIEMTKP